MGKGNRTRNERAVSTLATATPRKAPKKNKGMPTWVGTVIVIAVLVLVATFVTLGILSSRGVFTRNTVLLESENYEITVPMMSYMITTEYESLVNMYSSIGSGITIGGGTGGDALDTSATAPSLGKQIYSVTVDEKTGQTVTKTWLDKFTEDALSSIKELVACCEKAIDLGMGLTDVEKENVEFQLYAMTLAATDNGWPDLAGYLGARYGAGVGKKDVRKMLEMSQLASKYTNHMSVELKNGFVDSRIDTYYNENKSNYEKYIDYVGYTFTATFEPTKDTEGAAEKNAKLAEIYKQQQIDYEKYAEQLKNCANADEFTRKVYELVLLDEKNKIVAANDQYDSVDDLTAAEVSKCDATATAAMHDATVLNYAKPAGALTGIDGWLFKTEKVGEGTDAKDEYIRKPGDKGYEKGTANKDVDPATYEKVTSTYSAAIVLNGVHRNEEAVHSVGHILFESKTYDNVTTTKDFSGVIKVLADKVLARDGVLSAEAMADELVSMLKDDDKLVEKTKEDGTKYSFMEESTFNTYGQFYTGDSNVFYTDVERGQMVEEYENWLFAEGRVVGEVETVKTSYGYHIMYYKGDTNPHWKADVIEALSKDSLTNHLKEITEGTSFTVKDMSDKDWKKISL